MSDSRQTVKGSQIGGQIRQESDATHADQEVTNAEAKAIQQRVENQQTSIKVGKIQGYGKVGVLGAVVVVIVYLITKWLLK